jgi:hypothetical protein
MPHIHHLYWHIRCIQDLHDLTFIFIIQMKWSIEKVKYNSFMYLQFSHVPFSTRLLTCYVIKTKSCARWWMAIHLDTACFFYLVLLMIVSCWVLNHLTFRTLTPWWVEVEFLGHQAFWIYPFVGPPCGILWINHVFIVFLGTSIHISFSHELMQPVLLLAQVWIHWKLNWFFLPNPIFEIYLNFQQQNPLKNNNFHTLALKIMK